MSENLRVDIKEYLLSVGVEYYTALDYSDLRQINPGIIERAGFTPRSVLLFLLPYYTGDTVNLSRYAASLDYHLIIREITDGLISVMREHFPEGNYIGYGDHSPIDECNAALIGGLGLLGDNGLVINEEYGSYIFIADVVSDISPSVLGAAAPMEIKRCHHCGACGRHCPTGILRGEGEDCLSAITQRKGELTDGEVDLMRKYNTVWGCDECQSYCPYNREPKMTPIKFFSRDRIESLSTELLASMDKEAFSKRAFAWRGRKTVQRNLEYLNY